ncbi:helix-turn-helix transcriptional regulator [Paenibacillus sp. ISL-20]
MVGKGIRHFRKLRGLSQEELASKAEVHETYIQPFDGGVF